MTPEEAIEIVKARARGRTRYAGQEPRVDEVLVAHIAEQAAELERLRGEVQEGCDARKRNHELWRL